MVDPPGPGQPPLTAPDSPGVLFDSPGSLRIGARVGIYEILAFAGAGGMGEVYRARDTTLDRDVALKVLFGGDHQRLLREAQAMARLAHPNVVTVYEIGSHEDRLFLAMEFVEGRTLRKWMSERPRGAREVVGVFRRAGRGLAAVHGAGLVHGDFKPDNVIVGDDGRVRISDFGLSERPDAGSGTLSGTPAYMAPEQHRAQAAGGRADQFAFCVSMWEVLHGTRPHATPRDIVEGRLVEPPASARGPAWILAVLRRGLRVEAGDRFADMQALLDALGRDPAVRRRRVAVGLALLAAAAGVAVVARRSAQADPCAGAATHLAGAWDGAVRSSVHERFLASGRPYAQEVFQHVGARLDAYAAAWTAMRTQACEATAVRHEQSEALLDERMGCLDRRLGDLRALTARFSGAPDPDIVDRAVSASGNLERLDECADAEMLRAATPLPVDAEARAQVAALRGKLQAVRALRLTGKAKAAHDQAEALLPEVQKLGYPPLELSMFDELVTARGIARESRTQLDALHEELKLAARLRDARREAHIWASLIIEIAVDLSRPDEALAMREAAEASVARAGDNDLARGELFCAIGRAYKSKEDYPAAEAALRQGIELEARAAGHNELTLAADVNALAILHHHEGRYDEAVAGFQRALAIYEHEVSPGHPYVAGMLQNIGAIRLRQGQLAAARAAEERALAVFTAVHGPESRDVASAENDLAEIDLEEGRHAEAAARLARALAIKEKTVGPDHPLTITAALDLGVALAYLERFDEAAAMLERARVSTEKTGGTDKPSYAIVLAAQAFLAHRRGHEPEALALAERAIALDEKTLGRDHPDLAEPLLVAGEAQLALGHSTDAIAPLERVILIRGLKLGSQADLAAARLALADARWRIAAGDPSAIALAEDARAGYLKLGPGQEAGAGRADRWLAAHRR